MGCTFPHLDRAAMSAIGRKRPVVMLWIIGFERPLLVKAVVDGSRI